MIVAGDSEAEVRKKHTGSKGFEDRNWVHSPEESGRYWFWGRNMRHCDSEDFQPVRTDIHLATESLPILFKLTPNDNVSGLAGSHFCQHLDPALWRENQYYCYTLHAMPTNTFSRAHFPISELCWHFITPNSHWIFIILLLITI